MRPRVLHTLLILFFSFNLNLAIARGNSPFDVLPSTEPPPTPNPPQPFASNAAESIYLPLVLHPSSISFASSAPKINAPYFDGDIVFQETAIFWFGKVTPSENYTDVRVGYNEVELFVHLAVFDREDWYDKTPSPGTFREWDSAILYINPGVTSTQRFDGQLNHEEPRDSYQASYSRSGSSWLPSSVPFSTVTGWRGNGINGGTEEDRGWRITYRIPFTSLGLNGAPPEGTVWNLAISIFDRDDLEGTSIPEKRWPEEMDPELAGSWGELRFGLPKFSVAQSNSTAESVVIRHGLNGATVIDGTVGGGTNCGAGTVESNFFVEWGEANYAGAHQVNVQNQYDVADWPCFSKVYFIFPLDKIPAGRSILSATLTFYQFSNAGGGSYGIPPGSWIQVSKVNQSWDEATLTWNNAPQAWENYGSTWVDWILSPVPWPGIPRQWDVSQAVNETYSAGEPLRLVLYSSDSAQHSGKYFVSSDTGDWNEVGRPTLDVTFSNP